MVGLDLEVVGFLAVRKLRSRCLPSTQNRTV
jgi:hypothetical protein